MRQMAKSKAGSRSIKEETVKAKTGKGWDEWFSILDQWDVKEQGHTKTAAYLRSQYALSPWWSQAVTARYEWEHGLKQAESD
ncbi:DUF4287 domain-containing protein [Tolypothrix sp. PCC 7601]|uniref:DUF4287 domain-containing protein n=2 Tax=Tolypothrix TaxID=111782 RepID=UPI001F2DE9F8|nr:DUF4287 domain-containing protein [Tolypothrix sp. PCC 7601]